MPPVPLEQFRRECAGQPFVDLIELYTIRREGPELLEDVNSIFRDLGEVPRPLLEKFFNRWSIRILDPDLLQADCTEVMDAATAEGRLLLERAEVRPIERRLFELFQLATLAGALTAARHPATRRRLGVRRADELVEGSSPDP